MEKIKAFAADIVTACRMLFSLVMLWLLPTSAIFALLYLLCGISDVLDGFLARRFGTVSRRGELLDTIADLFFAGVYALKILPLLRLPTWLYIWIASIAIGKIADIIKTSKEDRVFRIVHSIANKLTGLFIFILPMTVRSLDSKYGAAVVCAVATFTLATELFSGRAAR